ncbi:MAG TPA: ATP-dependent DNA ligase [Terriglobia bacterium]|nr:ATP-dependent DNA ligase [Terriglobia bacterium]
MLAFSKVSEAVGSTTRKTEKVRLVADYLRSLPLDDAARAALFFTGQAYPRREERTTQVGGSLIWRVVSKLAGAERSKLEEVYRRHGDLGDVAQEVLPGKTAAGGLTLRELQSAFDELGELRGLAPRMDRLETLLGRAHPLEAKYIVKILTGELRIGLKESLVEEAIASAFGRPLVEVERANMLTGDIGATLTLAAADRLAEAKLRLFHPIGFMLASPAAAPEELMAAFTNGALLEDKYDGIRAQVHKRGDKVKFFSRTLDEIVEFHELSLPFQTMPGEFILDGEILGWRDGRPLPFTVLQQRLGRRQPDLWLPLEVPVSFVAFDVLYHNQQILLDVPLIERRRRLAELLAGASAPAVQFFSPRRCTTPEEVERAFLDALGRGNEGIMAKDPDSSYTPGRRGQAWIKLKRPLATLDVVVTAVEYGHGKRAGLLSDYTFSVREGDRLLTIGKAYSGLTDAEIMDLTGYFKQHTLEDQGFRREVEPTIVLEVAFNNIQRSSRHQSGYALRFPRVVRLRPDKPVAEIDQLERVKQLYERQAEPAGEGLKNG